MRFQKIATVKKEFEKETFLRELLIHLGTHAETPVDIVNAEFGEVTESVKEVLFCKAHVTGTCNASIGYDYKVKYYEDGKQKTKTETKWQPFSTTYAGDATKVAFNDNTGTTSETINTALGTLNGDSVVAMGEAEVHQAGLAKAIALCERAVEHNGVSFPGDRHKDVRYNSSSSVTTLFCYKLPCYETTYTYQGKTYNAWCFACGKPTITSETPVNEVTVARQCEELVEPIDQKRKYSWWAWIGTQILAFVGFSLRFLSIFPVAAVACLFYFNMQYKKEYAKHAKSLSSDLGKAKAEALRKALDESDYDSLSDDEFARIDSKGVPCPETPDKYGFKLWVAVFIAVVWAMMSFGN